MVHILAAANEMLEVSDYRISNLKLQKLLYYVYGVNLVINPDQELSEGPQAWAYGPVFPSVYRKFKQYGDETITTPALILPYGANGSIEVSYGSKLWEIIEAVYQRFGALPEFELVRRTHQPGAPWDQYYQPGKQEVTIRKPTIKKYFKERVVGNCRTIKEKPFDSSYCDLVNKLKSYLDLEEDWDGYGAVVPDSAVVNTAIDFANKLKISGIRAPKPMLSGDGEVGIYYREKGFFVDIGFEEDGLFSYFATDDKDLIIGGDDFSVNEDIPENLLSFIRKNTISPNG